MSHRSIIPGQVRRAFGERLCALMEQGGVSQADLRRAMGVAQTPVVQWQTGLSLPKAVTLLRLATFFDVSTDWLLGREGPWAR